jgi:hypothetical protein
VQVLQGSNPRELPVNFYFDASGLLVRTVRWNRTAAGIVPTQVITPDYRDVAGVKIPFRMVMTWTDGQNTYRLSDVQPNVQIDAAVCPAGPVQAQASRNGVCIRSYNAPTLVGAAYRRKVRSCEIPHGF